MNLDFPAFPVDSQIFFAPNGVTYEYQSPPGRWNDLRSSGGGGGKGSSVVTGDTAPGTPADGDLWWNSILGKLFVWYADQDSAQWVPASPTGSSTIIDARWFGATGDATQDAYPPLQAAINYATSLGAVSATVLIPGPGTYSLKTGELVVSHDNISIVIGAGAVLEQAVYTWSTIQIRNCNNVSVFGPGTIHNPVTKTQIITPPNYDGQAARERACGVYIIEANDCTVDGLTFTNMFLAVNLRPLDPATTINTGNRVSNCRFFHFDFGILSQSQEGLIIDNLQGEDTDLTGHGNLSPVPPPPHLIYISEPGPTTAPYHTRLTITNISDTRNLWSSSIKIKRTRGFRVDGLQCDHVARGIDISAEEGSFSGVVIRDMIDIGDSQQGGLEVDGNEIDIVAPIITLPINNNTLEAITVRDGSVNVTVRGGTITSNRTAPATAPIRIRGVNTAFIGVRTVETGTGQYAYSIESTAVGASVVEPIVRGPGNNIATVTAGALNSRIVLSLAQIDFEETNASIKDLGTGTEVSYTGKLPLRTVPALPFASLTPRALFMVTSAVAPLAASNGVDWIFSSGTVARSDAIDIWANQVVVNGGTVSPARITLLKTWVDALRTGGSWPFYDDLLLMAAENPAQALTSIKQRRLAVPMFSPVFTADRDYTFNGTNQLLKTGFIPSLHAGAMAGEDMRGISYERTNVGVSSTYSFGVSDTSLRGLMLAPRSSSNRMSGQVNSTATASVLTTMTDSRGLKGISRTAAGVYSYWNNGALFEAFVPASNATVLPLHEIYIGAINLIDVASNHRACSLALVAFGASLTTPLEASDQAAHQSLLTSLGAQFP